MKILEHLEVIEKLVLDRAAPSEIRGHIIAIREQLESYEQEAQKMSEYKKRIADLETENAQLKKPSSGQWGSKPYQDLSTD